MAICEFQINLLIFKIFVIFYCVALIKMCFFSRYLDLAECVFFALLNLALIFITRVTCSQGDPSVHRPQVRLSTRSQVSTSARSQVSLLDSRSVPQPNHRSVISQILGPYIRSQISRPTSARSRVSNQPDPRSVHRRHLVVDFENTVDVRACLLL